MKQLDVLLRKKDKGKKQKVILEYGGFQEEEKATRRRNKIIKECKATDV